MALFYPKHPVMTCQDAGMQVSDAVALRMWTFCRFDLMAVMAWELAYIPDLGVVTWLHHLFVILGVSLFTDEHNLAENGVGGSDASYGV